MAGSKGEDLQLLGMWASPFALRVRVALGLKGVSYEYSEQDLGNKSELLLKSNPVRKKVPVLIHGEKPICESLAIVEYVDEAFSGPSLLPSDPYDRAIARFWAAYIDSTVFPAWLNVIKSETEEAKAEGLQQIATGMELLEEAFKKSSKQKRFFNGDSIGYVDIALGSLLGWFKAMRKIASVELLDKAKTPSLVEWGEHFCSDAAVKEVLPDVDELVELSKAVQARG